MQNRLHDLMGFAGRPLPRGPSSLRNWFRSCLDAPKDEPIRQACEDWARARAKAGPDFAVPEDWFPRGFVLD